MQLLRHKKTIEQEKMETNELGVINKRPESVIYTNMCRAAAKMRQGNVTLRVSECAFLASSVTICCGVSENDKDCEKPRHLERHIRF